VLSHDLYDSWSNEGFGGTAFSRPNNDCDGEAGGNLLGEVNGEPIRRGGRSYEAITSRHSRQRQGFELEHQMSDGLDGHGGLALYRPVEGMVFVKLCGDRTPRTMNKGIMSPKPCPDPHTADRGRLDLDLIIKLAIFIMFYGLVGNDRGSYFQR
jgi:hypothetical protein